MSACCSGRVSKLCELKFPPPWITMERGSTVKTGSSTQIFNGYRRPSPGEKRSGRDVDRPFPSSVEDWERVELHLYSPSGPSWRVIEWMYMYRRLRLKCDGTRLETWIRLSTKRTSPFKSAVASVQSTTSRRGVRISGSNAGYKTFRGSVKSTGYPQHSPVSPSVPLPCVTVCHHISTEFQLSETAHSPSKHKDKHGFIISQCKHTEL